MLTKKTLTDFIDELASSSPAPGGGSVAALAGALGAALTSMVCNLTIGKKKYVQVEQELTAVLKKAESLRSTSMGLIDEDTAAFNEVMHAFGLPKGTEPEQAARGEAIQRATKKATLVPLRVMQLSEETLSLTRVVAEKGNSNSMSDAGVASLMCHSACFGARLNVQINLASLRDASFVHQTQSQVDEISRRVDEMHREILTRVESSFSNSR